MSRTMLMFLFSDKPDPYINAIAYSHYHLNISSICMVYVSGIRGDIGEDQAGVIRNSIFDKLDDLAKLDDIYKQISGHIRDRDFVTLKYSQLNTELNNLIKAKGGASKCIVDITGVTKPLGIAVFTVCLALGLTAVYTFDLLKRYDSQNPQASLYHRLARTDYNYTYLNREKPIKTSQNALVRKSFLGWLALITSLLLAIFGLTYFLFISGTSNQVTPLTAAASVLSLVLGVYGVWQLIQSSKKQFD